jgi:hypothetical protein
MNPMSPENRALLMRANRLLGAALVENNLVKVEDLEKANEKLLRSLHRKTFAKARCSES